MSEQECLLKVQNVSKSFPGVRALDNISFRVSKGSVHALVGENGAGKSTLMKILLGLYHPDTGKIYFNGEKKHFYTLETCLYQEFRTKVSGTAFGAQDNFLLRS
ncbi:MAG: hypothetical protein SAMD01599839_12380 [Rectinema sp.]